MESSRKRRSAWTHASPPCVLEPATTSDARALCRGDRDVLALDGLTFVGGAGVPLEPKETVIVVFGAEDVSMLPDDEGSPGFSVPVEVVTGIDVSGPGREVTGGGFIGGGFGLEGAMEGMALAAVLNSLTTSVRVRSFVRLAGPAWEAIFLHGKLEPNQLRHLLSPAFVRAVQAAAQAVPHPPASSDSDLVSRLERLASLLDRGMLSPDDYAVAKARILAGN